MYRTKIYVFVLAFIFIFVSCENSSFQVELNDTDEHINDNLASKSINVEIETENTSNTMQKEFFSESKGKAQDKDIDSDKNSLKKLIIENKLLFTDILGVWQASNHLAADWHDTFIFYSDGTFLFAYNRMDGKKRVIDFSGSWIMESGSLFLTVTNRTVVSGGELSESYWSYSGYEIEGGTFLSLTIDPPEILKFPLSTIGADDDPSVRYKTMTIGEKRYWQFFNVTNGVFNYVDVTPERPAQKKVDFFSVKLSDPSEFTDMEYVALVRHAGSFTTESNVWHYSIIGGELNNYLKGAQYYNKLNALFSKKTEPFGVFQDTTCERIIDNLFESYIVQISNDGTKLALESLNKDENGGVLYKVYSKNGKYSEFENKSGSLLFSSNLSWFKEGGVWRNVASKTEHPYSYWYVTNVDDTVRASKTYIHNYFRYDILDVKTNIELYPAPLVINSYGSSDINFIGCDYLIFSILQGEINPNVADYYKLNFKTNKLSFMFTSHVNGCFSPDGKYYAYYPFNNHTLVETEEKELGFYIYEIESGKTAYYPIEIKLESTEGENSVLSWANKKELDSFLQTN
jgi:hypothetical protein